MAAVAKKMRPLPTHFALSKITASSMARAPSSMRVQARAFTEASRLACGCHTWSRIQIKQGAGFHTSSRRQILPAGPQVIHGTANDPAPVPAPSSTHGSYHWAFERIISAALIPLTAAPFIGGSANPFLDAALCAGILIHSHIGFQSIIIDYIPAKKLPRTRVAFWWALRAATILAGVGMYEFETNDVGLTEAIKRIWMA